MAESREVLEKEFFTRIPKARKINPVFRAFFDFMYEAHLVSGTGKKVLNVFASHDFSGNREEVYHDKFFSECDYETIDFWQNHFIREGKPTTEPHVLPFDSNKFDIIVTTKNIMEHVSEPEKILSEFHRVLKPGGEIFLWASLIRRQLQGPYDYFRFTEYGLAHLLNKTGFKDYEIKHTNGSMATFTEYAYLFQRGINMPSILESFFNWTYGAIIQPIGFLIDRLDNGYGRDFTLYFLVRARKEAKI